MHLMDGIVSAPVMIGGFVSTAALCTWSAYKIKDDEIPKIAVFTAAFFVTSLIHFKIGPTSIHLLLIGLIGAILGRRSFLVFPVGLLLQFALIGEGGLSVIGVNSCIFGISALISWKVFEMLRYYLSVRFIPAIFTGFLGVITASLLLMTALMGSGEHFFNLARVALIMHFPILIIEGIVTGFTIDFLERVQPSILNGELTS